MNPASTNILNMPFIQVALPILIGFVAINWSQNKRIVEISKRIDDLANRLDKRLELIERRLERIETKLDDHSMRITRLEERTSLVRS